MIDDIMRKHVQEEQLSFSLPKLSIRHIYHNYRVVDLANSNMLNKRSEELSDKLDEISCSN